MYRIKVINPTIVNKTRWAHTIPKMLEIESLEKYFSNCKKSEEEIYKHLWKDPDLEIEKIEPVKPVKKTTRKKAKK
jgi:hypothetical protein